MTKKNEFRINQIKSLIIKELEVCDLTNEESKKSDTFNDYILIYFYTEKAKIPKDAMFKEDAIFINKETGSLAMYYYRCNIKADGSFGNFILNDILGFKTLKSFNDWCKYNDEEKMYALVEKEYIKQNFEKLQQLIEKKDNNKSKIIKI